MSPMAIKPELKIFTPIGMLGYGFSEKIFWSAVEDGVDAIILDSGSSDDGPSKLAFGTTTVTREAYERDLAILVAACQTHRVPVLIGSAGGDGSNAHVDMFCEIISNIINKEGYRSMKVVSIYAEIDKTFVHHKLAAGDITSLDAVPILLPSAIDEAIRVVGQMGLEPYLEVMKANPDFDIIVGGRSYDPAPYAAFCVYHGFTDLGIAYHMGKIMECGALCSTPKSKEAIAIVREDSFDLTPLDPNSRCTILSVAAHTLYEKSRPDILLGPGGALCLETATYEQLTDRTVRVRGAKFNAAKEGEYTVKIEGARVRGFHSVFFGGIRDPILIANLDDFIARIKAAVKGKVSYEFDLELHVFGRNGVMQGLEPDTESIPKEVALFGQARASTQDQANHIVNIARVYCMHGSYPNQLATAGNFAMPFAPLDIPMGPGCEFCIYHVVHKVDPVALFPVKIQTVFGTGTAVTKSSHAKVLAQQSVQPNESTPQSSWNNSTVGKRPLLKPAAPEGMCYIGDIAGVMRSKNAGPFELTLDVMFDDHELYLEAKNSGTLTKATIARLYQIPESDVITCLFWPQAFAFKATIKRPHISGSFGETDLHGSQQHAPLMYLPIALTESLRRRLAGGAMAVVNGKGKGA